jgi:hypothetical protein
MNEAREYIGGTITAIPLIHISGGGTITPIALIAIRGGRVVVNPIPLIASPSALNMIPNRCSLIIVPIIKRSSEFKPLPLCKVSHMAFE